MGCELICNQLSLENNNQLSFIDNKTKDRNRRKLFETYKSESSIIKNDNNTNKFFSDSESQKKNYKTEKNELNKEEKEKKDNLKLTKIKNEDSIFLGYINEKNNKKNGFGVLKWNDGDYYKGNFKDDNFYGWGIYYSNSTQSLFKGAFKNNQIYGFGIEEWKNKNNSKFIGNYINQKREIGTLKFNDNLKYEGKFNENNFNGNGTLMIGNSENELIKIHGFFNNNIIDKIVFYENLKENKKYYGEISDIFEFEGFGILKDNNNNNIYIGFWNNNELNGEGIIFNNKKIIQQGIFNNGNYCKRENTRFENINIEEIDNFFQ